MIQDSLNSFSSDIEKIRKTRQNKIIINGQRSYKETNNKGVVFYLDPFSPDLIPEKLVSFINENGFINTIIINNLSTEKHIEFLSYFFDHLTSVNIEELHLISTPCAISSPVKDKFLGYLEIHKQLVKFKIEPYRTLDDELLKEILSKLIMHENLRYIELIRAGIRRSQAKLLLDFARKTREILNLDLSCNFIENDFLAYLRESYEQGLKLDGLHINYNEIDDQGVKNLANILSQNKVLRKLSLDHNKIGKNSMIMIAEALKQNNQIFSLSLKSNNLSEQDIIHIKSAFNELMKCNMSLMDLQLPPIMHIYGINAGENIYEVCMIKNHDKKIELLIIKFLEENTLPVILGKLFENRYFERAIYNNMINYWAEKNIEGYESEATNANIGFTDEELKRYNTWFQNLAQKIKEGAKNIFIEQVFGVKNQTVKDDSEHLLHRVKEPLVEHVFSYLTLSDLAKTFRPVKREKMSSDKNTQENLFTTVLEKTLRKLSDERLIIAGTNKMS